jgi:hypothetical protein
MGAVQALDAESVRADKDTVVLLPYSVAGDINEENVNEYIDSLEEVVAEEAEG